MTDGFGPVRGRSASSEAIAATLESPWPGSVDRARRTRATRSDGPVSRRGFLGARYDYIQDPEGDGRTLNAGSVYLQWFPSEFSKLVAGYEAVSPSGGTMVNRLLLQASFSLGPHKPHPF